MMMGRLGYFHPFFGAWIPVFAFIILGLFLLKTAKT
jgi:lipopolysaccharide export LptBFGC system permease protein LptF